MGKEKMKMVKEGKRKSSH